MSNNEHEIYEAILRTSESHLGDPHASKTPMPEVDINPAQEQQFERNLQDARLLICAPSTMREREMQDVAKAYLGMLGMWVDSSVPYEKLIERNFSALIYKNPPYEFKNYSEKDIDNAFHLVVYQWGQIDQYLRTADLKLFNDYVTQLSGALPAYPDPRVGVQIIAEMTHAAKSMLYYKQSFAALHSGKAMEKIPDHIGYGKFSWFNQADMNAQQRVTEKIYRMIEEKRLRKKGTDMYIEKMTPIYHWVDEETGQKYYDGGYHTHSWKFYKSIGEFVGSCINKRYDWSGYMDLTSGNSLEPIIKKLISIEDDSFPKLEKDRHYLSFLDGIYHVNYDDFYAYDYETPPENKALIEKQRQLRLWLTKHLKRGPINKEKVEEVKRKIDEIQAVTRMRGTDTLSRNLVTAKYFKSNFVPEEFENFEEYCNSCKRSDQIHTPTFDRVLDHQKFYSTSGEIIMCSKFKCDQRAKFAVNSDSRPRFCSDHAEPHMVDKLKIRCSASTCVNSASHWLTKEEAQNNACERQKFCETHAQDKNCEPIPEVILNGGSVTSDGKVDQFSIKFMLTAMAGRLFYQVGEYDKFQVIPFLKGLANTGKTTIIKVFQNFYSPDDVQVLSNNLEKGFGLEPFVDKFLFVAPEIKDNFGLDQADFQTMVSGDPMSISRKYQLARTITWTVPGAMAGNTPPKWADKSGSIGRRVMIFPFDCPVRIVDNTLDEELAREMPLLVRRCNLAYHAILRYLSTQENKSIWSLVPARLLQAKVELQYVVSSLGYFLKENGEIIVDEGPDKQNNWVPWEFFVSKLHEFNIKMHQRPMGQLDPKEHSEFFATMGVDMVFEENAKGRPKQRMWPTLKKRFKGPFLYGMIYNPLSEFANEEQ